MPKSRHRQRPAPPPATPAPPAAPTPAQLALGYDPAWPMKSVDVVSAKAGWSEFELEDKTIVRLKLSLLDAKRVIDKFTPDGNPLYVLQWAVVNEVNAPDHLKKKKG